MSNAFSYCGYCNGNGHFGAQREHCHVCGGSGFTPIESDHRIIDADDIAAMRRAFTAARRSGLLGKADIDRLAALIGDES